MRPVAPPVATTVSLLAVVLLAACGGSPHPKVETSGVAALDQTATFVKWCVGQARDFGHERPTEILQWMCSTQGSATLTPPHPELEPDAAAHYAGPRPSDEAAWRCARRVHSPRYEIVVQADDTAGRIIAAAFDNAGDGFGPVHVWEWPVE